MAATRVFVECHDPHTVEMLELQAVGLGTLFFRWEMIANRRSKDNPELSLDLEIPDFRPSDIPLIQSYPGVERANVFPTPDNTPFPDVHTRRKELLPKYIAAHSAAI